VLTGLGFEAPKPKRLSSGLREVVQHGKERKTMRRSLWAAFALALALSLGIARAQEEKKEKKARDIEAVISDVGQRTITFQYERKQKVREEVVGIDDKTDLEKDGRKIKLKDLQPGDKVVIRYEPDAYTPAIAVKVVGKGEIQKRGGDD
jgi:hypothetical protein